MTAADALADAAQAAHAALADFEQVLCRIKDADLHRADSEGGWTVAQIVSHMHLSGLLWIADLERLRHHDTLFIFREELGHDAVGAPPPSAEDAARRIGSLRVALTDCLPAADPVVLAKSIEVPPFGTLSVARLMPLIIGHLSGHAEQARTILRSRGAIPADLPGGQPDL